MRMPSSLAVNFSAAVRLQILEQKLEKASKEMPAGRKGGKGSGAQTKSSSSKTRGPASKGAQAAKAAIMVIEEEGSPTQQPNIELEGVDEVKLFELSADEPESSECK